MPHVIEDIHPISRDVASVSSAVSFQDLSPRPPHNSGRPVLSESTSNPSNRKINSPASGLNAKWTETCGYCSDHGELAISKARNHKASSTRRLSEQLTKVQATKSQAAQERAVACCHGGDMFCMLCDNTAYMPPDDPEVLLQVAQALEQKAHRDLLKAEVLRQRLSTPRDNISTHVPVQERSFQGTRRLGMDVPVWLKDPKTLSEDPQGISSSSLMSSSKCSTVPAGISTDSNSLITPKFSMSYQTPLSASSTVPVLSSPITGDNNQYQPRSPHRLRKRRPKFADADWPKIVRQNSQAKSTFSTMHTKTGSDVTEGKTNMWSSFSTRFETQLSPFLGRSTTTKK